VPDTDTESIHVERRSISRILQLRDRIADKGFEMFYGYTPVGGAFDDLVDQVHRCLSKVRKPVLRTSLEHLAGQRLDRQTIYDTAWRLAGNMERLRQDEPVLPWSRQKCREWVPIQVMSYEPHATKRGQLGGMFRVRILAGTPCPMILRVFWPITACTMIARHCGYTARWHAYPFADRSELVNMRLLALIDPELCKPNQPRFFKVASAPALLKWNRNIIQKRFRKGGNKPWPCPLDYTHRCFECHVGYLDCPAATHRETIRPVDEVLREQLTKHEESKNG